MLNYTMGEVEEFDSAIDDGKTESDEGIYAACNNAVYSQLFNHIIYSP